MIFIKDKFNQSAKWKLSVSQIKKGFNNYDSA